VKRAVLPAVLLLLLPLALLSPAAHAVGTGDPQVVSPVEDQVVPQGYVGPVRVDFSDAPAAEYDIWVECPPGEGDGEPVDDYFWSRRVTYTGDGTDDVFESAIDPLTTPGAQTCMVSVFNQTPGSSGEAHLTFSTAAAELSIGSATASPRVFYPRLRDGFRDATTMTWTVSKPSAVRGRVLDGRGRTVRYVNLGRVDRQGSWTWRGWLAGRRAPTGRYSLQVSATDLEHRTVRRAAVPVRLAAGMATRRSSLRVVGSNYSESQATSSCSVTRDLGHAVLACTRAGHAQVWYRFRVDRGAFDVRREVLGQRGCCAPGTVTRQLQRINGNTYRVGVRVTGSRSYTVVQARLLWAWKQAS
jgi:hypothetical protein